MRRGFSQFGKAMQPRLLSLCGVAAPLLFVFMAILGGAMRPGYSHVADTVSELLSPGSPNRALLTILFTAYSFLMALFGYGMYRFVRKQRANSRLGSLAASLFVIAGVINLTIATVFPQDPWGAPRTFAGEMHLILSGVIGLLQLLSISMLGVWFYRTGVSGRLAAYSFLTTVAIVLSIALFLGMVDTPLMGLGERVMICYGLLWTFVIGWWMASHPSSLARGAF